MKKALSIALIVCLLLVNINLVEAKSEKKSTTISTYENYEFSEETAIENAKEARKKLNHVYIEQRFIYEHTHSVFVPEGNISPVQDTIDAIPENGFSHIDNNKRPYYDDHNMINYLIQDRHDSWGTSVYQIYSDGYTYG